MRRNKEQQAAGLDLAEQVGYAAAAEQLGVSVLTVRSWASRAGRCLGANTEAAVAAAKTMIATTAQRKSNLASGLLDDIDRLRQDLFAPTVERKAVIVSGGKDNGSDVEVVDIRHPTTSASERKLTMTAIAIAVDKVQILTGEATERIETLTGAKPEDDALVVVDELARRRVS